METEGLHTEPSTLSNNTAPVEAILVKEDASPCSDSQLYDEELSLQKKTRKQIFLSVLCGTVAIAGLLATVCICASKGNLSFHATLENGLFKTPLPQVPKTFSHSPISELSTTRVVPIPTVSVPDPKPLHTLSVDTISQQVSCTLPTDYSGTSVINNGEPFLVNSHIRNLPQGRFASPEKIAEAASYNITLEEGQTFVSPYYKNMS